MNQTNDSTALLQGVVGQMGHMLENVLPHAPGQGVASDVVQQWRADLLRYLAAPAQQAMTDGRILTCVYCGHEYPQDTQVAAEIESTAKAITAWNKRPALQSQQSAAGGTADDVIAGIREQAEQCRVSIGAINTTGQAASPGEAQREEVNRMDVIVEAFNTWPDDLRKKLSLHDLRRMTGWTPPSAAPAASGGEVSGGDAKDAARYRWLRFRVNSLEMPRASGVALDRAIDAALAREAQP